METANHLLIGIILCGVIYIYPIASSNDDKPVSQRIEKSNSKIRTHLLLEYPIGKVRYAMTRCVTYHVAPKPCDINCIVMGPFHESIEEPPIGKRCSDLVPYIDKCAGCDGLAELYNPDRTQHLVDIIPTATSVYSMSSTTPPSAPSIPPQTTSRTTTSAAPSTTKTTTPPPSTTTTTTTTPTTQQTTTTATTTISTTTATSTTTAKETAAPTTTQSTTTASTMPTTTTPSKATTIIAPSKTTTIPSKTKTTTLTSPQPTTSNITVTITPMERSTTGTTTSVSLSVASVTPSNQLCVNGDLRPKQGTDCRSLQRCVSGQWSVVYFTCPTDLLFNRVTKTCVDKRTIDVRTCAPVSHSATPTKINPSIARTTTMPTAAATSTAATTTHRAETASPTSSAPHTAVIQYACKSSTTVFDLANHVTSHNASSSSCVSGDHAGGEAFVLNHCNVDLPTTWTRGENVMSLCNRRLRRVPVATFYGGYYTSGLDVSAVFLGCIEQQALIGIQMCTGGTRIERLSHNGVGYKNAALYFVIQ